MKELISSLVCVVIVALIMELFCPQKYLKTVVMSAFSLVVIVLIISGVKEFINKDYKEEFNINEEISYSLDIIADSSTKHLENQILNVCSKEGIDNILSVKIKVDIEALNINYSQIKIVVSGDVNQDKIKEIVQKIIPSINKENIVVV